MRVIITGGTGMIGRALSERLVKDSHEVVVLSRDPSRVAGLAAQVQVVGWDGRTAEGWGHLADGAGAIVNLAGAGIAEGRWTAERKRVIRDSRVQAGQAVVAAVRAATTKPGVVIQSSAVGYYGPHGDEILSEEAPAVRISSPMCAGIGSHPRPRWRRWACGAPWCAPAWSCPALAAPCRAWPCRSRSSPAARWVAGGNGCPGSTWPTWWAPSATCSRRPAPAGPITSPRPTR